jgi:predicted N-formylglutamate amidohydrolase
MDPFCCTTYHGVLASMLTPLCAEPEVLKPAQNIDHGLLSADDPTPVEWVNKNSQSPVMLLCEHAGNTLPGSKNQLGLQPQQLTEHIAWDIGAAAVARKVAAALDAPLLLQRYSRLLIDCNRPPESDESIPEYSDSIAIPGNQNLTSQDRQARQQEIFYPLDNAINETLQQHTRTAAFSIHSFTPQMQGQPSRPWHCGMLTRTSTDTARSMIDHLQKIKPSLTLALNEPYCIDDETDWFIPRYAEPHGLAHCLIEIRNDQILTEDGVNTWSELISMAINAVMDTAAST